MKNEFKIMIGIIVILIFAISGMYFIVDKNQNPAFAGNDEFEKNYEDDEKENLGKIVTYSPNGNLLSLTLPENWEYDILSQSGDFYEYGIKFYPIGSEENVTLYYYSNIFGVCGTGLRSEKFLINSGIEAEVGYYDQSDDWSFIAFHHIDRKLAAINNGLTGLEAENALEILKTLKYEKNDTNNEENFIFSTNNE